jgi:threonine synthase
MEYDPRQWRCDCFGAWEAITDVPFNPQDIVKDCWSIFRYRKILDLDYDKPYLDLGAGWTPIVDMDLFGHKVKLKLDYFTVSGSNKDRGTCFMINQMIHQKVTNVLDDSSGNAAAALSAYGNAAGMDVDIYVPSMCSEIKVKQICSYGSRIHLVEGDRYEVTKKAIQALTDSVVYASHVYHPCNILGQETMAYEVWEQLNGKIPDVLIVPVAQGSAFLGIYYGFRRLYENGLTDKIPRMVAVQSENVAPVVVSFDDHSSRIKTINPQYTIAEGIAVANPVRGENILKAIYDTNGCAVAVNDEEIRLAKMDTERKGIGIEMTSAAAVAALHKLGSWLQEEDDIMILLTSSGLKTP